MTDLAALERAADGTLAAFSTAILAEKRDWLAAMRGLFARPGFAARALALLERADVAACEPLPDGVRNVVELLGQRIGEDGYAPGLALLTRLHRAHPDRAVRIYVGHGLFGLGAAGLDALADAGPDEDRVVNLIRARAALARGDDVDAVIAGPAARRRAVLEALGRDLPRIDADPRWLPWIVGQLADPETHVTAEHTLDLVPAARWRPLVPQAKARKPRPPSAAAIAKLDRELRAHRAALVTLVAALRKQKYRFQARTPLSAPVRGHAGLLAKLEARVGPVPASLARFWAIVGSVDLRGDHPAWPRRTWLRTRADEPIWYADPLVVCSVRDAWREAEDGEFDLADARPLERYRLAIAGDEVTKANYSGGEQAIVLDHATLDAPLDPTGRTFLAYLRDAIAWRGFPGFAAIPDPPHRPDGLPSARAPRRRPRAPRRLRR